MITRKIGKLLRGKVTPAQLMLACVLGSLLGFVPGFAQGPGLTVLLVGLLIVLNANLLVAGLVALLAKALCLLLMPFSFAVGRVLLDGPTEPLFKWMINAPVLALFGFEHYATTGGVVVGLAFGVVLGIVLVKAITAFRRRMAKLEEGSPRFVELSKRWWARLLTFLLVGGKRGKKSYGMLLERKGIGNPIRTLGAALVVLVAILAVVLYQFASEPIVTAYLQRGLEKANGATVDLERVQLDLGAGKLTVTGFAMADPNDLGRDLLRAKTLEADISATDLLRKRVALDRLVLVDASTGETRRVPGHRVGPPVKPADSKDDDVPDAEKLEKYVGQAKAWRERLAQARRWLEPLTGGEDAPDKESRAKRLDRQIAEVGYARVAADHLVTGAPTVAVYELVADGVRTPYLQDETIDLRGENLSTHPHLLEQPARLSVTSSGGTITADIRESAGDAPAALELHCRGLSGDAIGKQLATGGTPPIQGGTVDIDASGTWGGAAGLIDLPLTASVRDSTLSFAGAQPTKVNMLVVPIAVRGTLDDPRITISDKALADALVAAGAAELAKRVGADEVLGRALDEIPPESRDQVGDTIKKGLEGVLGPAKKKDAPPKPGG